MQLRRWSLRSLLFVVTVLGILFAMGFSRYSHRISETHVKEYSPGDTYDVFMMPPKGVYLEGGFEINRLCRNVEVSSVDKDSCHVEIKVSAFQKWQLLTCKRALWLIKNQENESSIWLD